MSTCKVCSEPLLCPVEDDDEAPVPDDLELPCGCHYHWQCLMDQSEHVALDLSCPSCKTYLPANEPGPSVSNPVYQATHKQAILTRYTTEEGTEENYDILPVVTEEAYLASHPSERRARAFHTFCAQGDILGTVELLKDAAGEGDDIPKLVMYRDPLNKNKSGMHLSIEKAQEEAVFLLLYIGAPKVPLEAFPQEALDLALSVGLNRLDVAESICALRDDDGLTAEDYARNAGGRWERFLQAGVLSI